MYKYLISLLVFFCIIRADEFLYPIAAISDQEFLVIYQKTPQHIELWQWNIQNKHAENILLSRYTPAGVRVLPGNVGYSFVDNGIIKIKKWQKRSPGRIEIDGPLSHIELISWIDEESFYTSARYKYNFGIFQIDYQGNSYPILVNDGHDFTYPQKVNDSLYCIEKDSSGQYRIVRTTYNPQGLTLDEFSDRINEYTQSDQPEIIIESGFQPMIFLTMLNDREGYYFTHPQELSRRDRQITFTCQKLHRHKEGWQSYKMFEWSVPSGLIFTGKSSRLYEALLPLIPKYHEPYFYYIDCSTSDNLNIFRYHSGSGKTKQITQAQDEEHYFAPLALDDYCIYGGKLCDHSTSHAALKMGINKGFIAFELGVFPYKSTI